MFDNLTDKLQRAFKNLRGQGKLSEENITEALREIRLALLEADVNFKVVKELIDHIRDKAVGQEVMTALSPAEQVVKIVRDELIELLGRTRPSSSSPRSRLPSCSWPGLRARAKPPPPASSHHGSKRTDAAPCWSRSTSIVRRLASS